MARSLTDARCLLSPGLAEAPVLDVLCSHFVLTLTLRQAGRFNLRRDWNSLLSLVGRHLVWPPPVLGACAPSWRSAARATRSGRATNAHRRRPSWNATAPGAGPTKKARCSSTSTSTSRMRPRTCWHVLGSTCDWIARRLKKESTLVQKNIDALAGLLQLNPAERALLLYGTLARYQRDLRGLLVEFKVSNAQEAYAALAAVAGVDAARWPRRCAPARGWSASAWWRT
jgi:hypothetical protein